MLKSILKVFLIVLAAAAVAEESSAQSIFGINFIGEHQFRGSSRYKALGNSALAVPDTNNTITMNTASLADLTSVTFSLYELEGMSSINYGDYQANQNRFQLPSAMLALPVAKNLVLGVGYWTRYCGRADFSLRKYIEGSPTPWDVYKLNSSLFSTPFSISWKPLEWIAVATELQLERGSIKDEVSVVFHDSDYIEAISTRNRSFSGTSWAASALVRIHPRLFAGVSFNDGVNYSVDEKIDYNMGEPDSSASWDFTLPAAYGVGLAVGVTERWWLTSAWWSRSAPEPTGFPQLKGSIGDEHLLAFGLERRAAHGGRAFSRIPIRLGFYENRWHLEFPEGKPVVSRFFTMGSGFPLPGGPGSLDFSIEIGKIGSANENGIDETVLRFGLSLSVSEKWSRRKTETH